MQTAGFNVSIEDVLTPSDTLSLVLKTVKKCTHYKVEAEHGFRAWGGDAISLIELIAIVSEFKFYKYKNKKVLVEDKYKLASFCEKPFTCEYVTYIGATFFDDINRRIIKYPHSAIDDVVPYALYKARSGKYYCWGHLTIEHTDEGWTLFEVFKKESIEKVQVIEK